MRELRETSRFPIDARHRGAIVPARFATYVDEKIAERRGQLPHPLLLGG
jgi:hypothetical protein